MGVQGEAKHRCLCILVFASVLLQPVGPGWELGACRTCAGQLDQAGLGPSLQPASARPWASSHVLPAAVSVQGPSLMHAQGLLLVLLPPWMWQDQSTSRAAGGCCSLGTHLMPQQLSRGAKLYGTSGEGSKASPLPISCLLPHPYQAHLPLPHPQPLSQNGNLRLGNIPT